MGDQEALDRLVSEKAEGGLTSAEKAEIAERVKKLKDVNVNLAYARHAVAAVLRKAKKAANWDEPLPWSAEGIYNRTGSEEQSVKAWDNADRCVYGQLRRDAGALRLISQGGVRDVSDIRLLGGLAASYGCGNCGEMAALAFLFLYDLGVRPLDFMLLKQPADHAFVVIGRRGSPDDDELGLNWGDSAVVCDPWAKGLNKPLAPGTLGPPDAFGLAHAAYPAKQLGSKMTAMHAGYTGVTVTASA